MFEICEPPTKRFLNALRIREEENGGRMPWSRYKIALLERMQNSSTIDGLISFILKPRDNNCPIGLWVAERIAERHLLNDDGIEMSEDTWLELLLAFIPMRRSRPFRFRQESSAPRTTTVPDTTC